AEERELVAERAARRVLEVAGEVPPLGLELLVRSVVARELERARLEGAGEAPVVGRRQERADLQRSLRLARLRASRDQRAGDELDAHVSRLAGPAPASDAPCARRGRCRRAATRRPRARTSAPGSAARSRRRASSRTSAR